MSVWHPFEGSETWDYMQDMVLSLKKEIEHCEMIDLVLCAKDMKENGHIKAILTVEGMCGIKEHAREKSSGCMRRGTDCLLLLERGKSAGNRRKGKSRAWPSSARGRGITGND